MNYLYLLSRLFFPLSISLAVLPSLAQDAPSAANSYSQKFASGMTASCIKTPGELSVAQAKKFCRCYANAFVSRFSVEELQVLSLYASRSPDARDAIQVAMSPARTSCLAETNETPRR